MDLEEVQGLQQIKARFYSYFNGQQHGNRIWTGWDFLFIYTAYLGWAIDQLQLYLGVVVRKENQENQSETAF